MIRCSYVVNTIDYRFFKYFKMAIIIIWNYKDVRSVKYFYLFKNILNNVTWEYLNSKQKKKKKK